MDLSFALVTLALALFQTPLAQAGKIASLVQELKFACYVLAM